MRVAVIYYISDSFIKNKLNNNFNYSNDKKTYLELNDYLNILRSLSNVNNNKSVLELINHLINILSNTNILEKKDIKAYRAYIKDLINIGYNFYNCICNESEYNIKNYVNMS